MTSIRTLASTMSFSRALAETIQYGVALDKRILFGGSFGSAVECYYEDEAGLALIREMTGSESFRRNVSQATGISPEELRFSENRLAQGDILHLYGHVYGLSDADWLSQEKRAKGKCRQFALSLIQAGATTGTLRYEASQKAFSLRTGSGDELESYPADQAKAVSEQHDLRSLNADYFDQTNEVFLVLDDNQTLILSLPGKPEDGGDFLLSFEITPRMKENEK